jgi:nicotinamidase-related amidase
MKALLIIDMQQAMQDRIDAGRDHVDPEAPARVAALAAAFRRQGMPVIHVRHQDADPDSPFHPQASGYPPMPCARALDGEPVFLKRTSSAFASTDLQTHLQGRGITDLVVTGAVTGFCVNSTVRAGADLGFRMTVVRDAVLGFGLPSARLSARAVSDVTLALLAADFAEIVDAASVLSA